jgi:hypothetical protein
MQKAKLPKTNRFRSVCRIVAFLGTRALTSKTAPSWQLPLIRVPRVPFAGFRLHPLDTARGFRCFMLLRDLTTATRRSPISDRSGPLCCCSGLCASQLLKLCGFAGVRAPNLHTVCSSLHMPASAREQLLAAWVGLNNTGVSGFTLAESRGPPCKAPRALRRGSPFSDDSFRF